MATKTKATKTATKKAAVENKANTNTDGLDIPDFLKAENRTEAEKAFDAAAAQKPTTAQAAGSSKVDFRKPKGMSEADWQAHQQAAQATKAEATKARIEKVKAKAAEKAPKQKQAREGKLSAHDFAKVLKCPAKIVRRALRTLKTLPKPAGGWYFDPADKDKVLAVVKQYLEGKAAGLSDKKLREGAAAAAKPAKKAKKA